MMCRSLRVRRADRPHEEPSCRQREVQLVEVGLEHPNLGFDVRKCLREVMRILRCFLVAMRAHSVAITVRDDCIAPKPTDQVVDVPPCYRLALGKHPDENLVRARDVLFHQLPSEPRFLVWSRIAENVDASRIEVIRREPTKSLRVGPDAVERAAPFCSSFAE